MSYKIEWFAPKLALAEPSLVFKGKLIKLNLQNISLGSKLIARAVIFI
jgi:hypothetical protein